MLFCRGVLNVVHGTRDVVNNILDHPDIKAVSFVGSNAAGRYISERASANGKRVQVSLYNHPKQIAACPTAIGWHLQSRLLFLASSVNCCGGAVYWVHFRKPNMHARCSFHDVHDKANRADLTQWRDKPSPIFFKFF